MPVAQRLAECAKIYADAGLPLIVRITPFTLPVGLDALLAPISSQEAEQRFLARFEIISAEAA